MSNITVVASALTTEFSDVAFAAALPTTFTAPSVVVAPGDPFLAPSTFGGVTETWDVLVVVSFKDKAAGLIQMRDLSLRVREVVSKAGATWRQASGPRIRDGEANKDFVMSVNQITFDHIPQEA
jgi:hypothetical protein